MLSATLGDARRTPLEVYGLTFAPGGERVVIACAQYYGNGFLACVEPGRGALWAHAERMNAFTSVAIDGSGTYVAAACRGCGHSFAPPELFRVDPDVAWRDTRQIIDLDDHRSLQRATEGSPLERIWTLPWVGSTEVAPPTGFAFHGQELVLRVSARTPVETLLPYRLPDDVVTTGLRPELTSSRVVAFEGWVISGLGSRAHPRRSAGDVAIHGRAPVPERITTRHGAPITAITADPQSRRLYTCAENGSIITWKRQGDDLVEVSAFRTAHAPIGAACILGPDGWLVTAQFSEVTPSVVQVWSDEKVVSAWEAPGKKSRALAAHPTERRVAVGGHFGYAVYDIARKRAMSWPFVRKSKLPDIDGLPHVYVPPPAPTAPLQPVLAPATPTLALGSPVALPSIDTLPHLSVGTIGHIGHGKTSLTAALAALAHDPRRAGGDNRVAPSYERIAAGGVCRESGHIVSLFCAPIEYATETRRYTHIDCPGGLHYARNAFAGIGLLDAAILVVNACDSVMPQTQEHLLFAKAAGIGQVVVFLTRTELVEEVEMLDLVEAELRQMFRELRFEVPIIVRGSTRDVSSGDSLGARSVRRLASVLDTLAIPPRKRRGPFKMQILRKYVARGVGVVAAGRVERGSLRAGEQVDIVGERPRYPHGPYVAASIQTFGRRAEVAEAGSYVGVRLQGVEFDRHSLRRGFVLAQPGTLTRSRRFEATLTPASASLASPRELRDDELCQVHLGTDDVRACIRRRSDPSVLELARGVVVEVGQGFVLRNSEGTCALGRVLRILD